MRGAAQARVDIPTIPWYGYTVCCGVRKPNTLPILMLPILENPQVFSYLCRSLTSASCIPYKLSCRMLENNGGCVESIWLPKSQHNEMDWAQTLGEAGKYKGIYTKLLVFHVANMRKIVCE